MALRQLVEAASFFLPEFQPDTQTIHPQKLFPSKKTAVNSFSQNPFVQPVIPFLYSLAFINFRKPKNRSGSINSRAFN